MIEAQEVLRVPARSTRFNSETRTAPASFVEAEAEDSGSAAMALSITIRKMECDRLDLSFKLLNPVALITGTSKFKRDEAH